MRYKPHDWGVSSDNRLKPNSIKTITHREMSELSNQKNQMITSAYKELRN